VMNGKTYCVRVGKDKLVYLVAVLGSGSDRWWIFEVEWLGSKIEASWTSLTARITGGFVALATPRSAQT
jgi:hypothetical protein